MKKVQSGSLERSHGNRTFWIEGEGFIGSSLLGELAPSQAAAAAVAAPAGPTKPFRFCRLFPNLPQFQPPAAGLIELGQAMTAPNALEPSDSTIPSGFTYLGQFVDHDITFDKSALDTTGSLDPDQIEQARSPSLDLDSVYGLGPQDSPELYSGEQLRVGMTTPTAFGGGNTNLAFPNDLLRLPPDPDPALSKRAVIGDPRNDENLAVAQTHLAFVKLHNRVVNTLASAGMSPAAVFDEARKTVTQHYQSIVLHDFVSRLAMPAVFGDVLTNGRRFFMPNGIAAGDHPCMPVEFSVAGYRLGHSMIRNSYEWNRVFESPGPGPMGTLELLFEFSAGSGDFNGLDTLPSNWIIDWTRFFDFTGVSGVQNHSLFNMARLIDSRLTGGLSDLPEFANHPEPHMRSLAARNLLRGRLVGLPSAQAIAAAMSITPLTDLEIRSGAHGTVLAKHGFELETPLWYYILKEAEVQQGGRKLGELGSRLLVETFHGLIEGSQFSILKQTGWAPSLPAINTSHFTMADLLAFVGDLNPLGT